MQLQTQIIPPVTFLFGTLNYIYNTANNVANVRNPSTETYVWADTTLGRIRGTKQVSRIGKSFYQFRGIPYAKNPVGDLRFEVSCHLFSIIIFNIIQVKSSRHFFAY